MSECKPKVTVKYDGKTLTEGTDYTVKYSSNKNAGTATVKITGKGNYTGTVTEKYTIAPNTITGAVVTFEKGTSVKHTGSTITNKISSVEVDGKKLTSGKDYTIADSDKLQGKDVGSYTVTLTGKGNYTGEISAKWKIVKNEDEDDDDDDEKSSDDSDSNDSDDSDSSTDDDSAGSDSSGDSGGGAASYDTSDTDEELSEDEDTSEEESSVTPRRSSSSSGLGSGGGGSSTGSTKSSVSKNSSAEGESSADETDEEEADFEDEEEEEEDEYEDGEVPNILTPAPGYEDDSPIEAQAENTEAIAKAVLAGDFRDAIENGSEIEVWIDVQSAEDLISDDERQLAEETIVGMKDRVEGLCIGRYLFVNVYLQIDKSGWNEVKETNYPVAIDFSVPESMKSITDRYYVLCIHDGEAELMSDINDDPDIITVMTQYMQATYVLLYQHPDAAVAGEIFAPEYDSEGTEASTSISKSGESGSENKGSGTLPLVWAAFSSFAVAGYGVWNGLTGRGDQLIIQLMSNLRR